ncbi:MAG: DMT family transporter [Patescibacteria group bacterium]
MQKMKKFGSLFIVIASLLWSFDGILRRSLYSLPPAVVVFYEHVLGAIVLLPFMYSHRKEVAQMTRKEWLAIAVVGLFSGALGTIFYTAALGKVNYIQFSVVVLLQQLQPIWAILTASLLLKEKLSPKFLFFAVLAIVGSYFVTFKDLRVEISPNNATLIAALLALGAGMMWATSTSFSKIVLNKVSFITATFLRFLLAPIFAFMFIVVFNQTGALTQINTSQWMTLITIMLSTGMVALLIYYYGLKKTPARVSAICELVWPISAIFLDYFYFKNGLSFTQMIGVAVVLFSIYKISTQKEQHEMV